MEVSVANGRVSLPEAKSHMGASAALSDRSGVLWLLET